MKRKKLVNVAIICMLVGFMLLVAVTILANYILFFHENGRTLVLLLTGIVGASTAIAFWNTDDQGNIIDGDLIAGAEDEDGLVFSLNTPVEELVKKDQIIFHVVKKEEKDE